MYGNTTKAESTSGDQQSSLHDCLSLGEIEAGLEKTDYKKHGPSAEEIHRLPLLLRLLSTARPLSSIPSSFLRTDDGIIGVNDNCKTKSASSADDTLVNEVVDHLEDVAATYSVAESVDVVTCYLAPSICRRISRLQPIRKAEDGTWNTQELFTATTILDSQSSLRHSGEGKGREKVGGEDDDGILSDANDKDTENNEDGEATEEEDIEQYGRQPQPKRRRVSITTAKLPAIMRSEDSQESMVTRTLQELSTLTINSLDPIEEINDSKPEQESPTQPGEAGATPIAENETGAGHLSLSVEDLMILSEVGENSNTDSIVSVTATCDLGSTIAALMYNAPVLRHQHVANAICRSSIAHGSNLISSMGANCPSGIPCLLKGCIEAFNSANDVSRRRNVTISNAAKSSVLALGELSERECSRVISTLQYYDNAMIDVQLELSIKQKNSTGVASLLIENLSSLSSSFNKTNYSGISAWTEEIGTDITTEQRKQLQGDEALVLEYILQEENHDLLNTTLNFILEKLLATTTAKESIGNSRNQQPKISWGKLCLLLSAYSWLLYRIDVTKCMTTKENRQNPLFLLPDIVGRLISHIRNTIKVTQKNLNLDRPIALVLSSIVLSLSRLSVTNSDKTSIRSAITSSVGDITREATGTHATAQTLSNNKIKRDSRMIFEECLANLLLLVSSSSFCIDDDNNLMIVSHNMHATISRFVLYLKNKDIYGLETLIVEEILQPTQQQYHSVGCSNNVNKESFSLYQGLLYSCEWIAKQRNLERYLDRFGVKGIEGEKYINRNQSKGDVGKNVIDYQSITILEQFFRKSIDNNKHQNDDQTENRINTVISLRVNDNADSAKENILISKVRMVLKHLLESIYDDLLVLLGNKSSSTNDNHRSDFVSLSFVATDNQTSERILSFVVKANSFLVEKSKKVSKPNIPILSFSKIQLLGLKVISLLNHGRIDEVAKFLHNPINFGRNNVNNPSSSAEIKFQLFLFQLFYWLIYVDQDPKSPFAADLRTLPLKEVYHICGELILPLNSKDCNGRNHNDSQFLLPSSNPFKLSMHVRLLIEKLFPEIPAQSKRWNLQRQSVNIFSTLKSGILPAISTPGRDNRRSMKRLLSSILGSSTTTTKEIMKNNEIKIPASSDCSSSEDLSNYADGYLSESVFLLAQKYLSDDDLCTTAARALLSSQNSPLPSFTYSMLTRDPLVLLKCPMRVWHSRGLRHILLSVLFTLVETNDLIVSEESPLIIKAGTDDLIACRNILLIRCLLQAVSGGRNQKENNSNDNDGGYSSEAGTSFAPIYCSQIIFFIRYLVAKNRGLIGMLVKQGLSDSAIDWLVEYVPETMDDYHALNSLLLEENGSVLTAAEKLTAADAIVRIAIAHGERNCRETEALVFGCLVQLISSFFLVVGPVGVPVNVLVSEQEGQHDELNITQISRKATFRILESLQNVRGRRKKLRNECSMALQKLAALCKGENNLSGITNVHVVSRRKNVLREIYDSICRAASAMGSGIDL